MDLIARKNGQVAIGILERLVHINLETRPIGTGEPNCMARENREVPCGLNRFGDCGLAQIFLWTGPGHLATNIVDAIYCRHRHSQTDVILRNIKPGDNALEFAGRLARRLHAANIWQRDGAVIGDEIGLRRRRNGPGNDLATGAGTNIHRFTRLKARGARWNGV